jgi:hypothetical protein
MKKQPCPSGRPWSVFHGYNRRLVVLSVGVIAAAVGMVAVDRYGVAPREPAGGAEHPVGPRVSVPLPEPSPWGSRLTPGTEAPHFNLVDVRTGERVSLDQHRDGMPVVLLLSSFG